MGATTSRFALTSYLRRWISAVGVPGLYLCCVLWGVTAHAQGQPPGTMPPTEAEQQVYDAKLGRLQANADDMPTPIDEVLATSFGGFSLLPIDCPDGTAVTRVDVTIYTSLVRWDADLAVANSAGTYDWNCTFTVERGVKTLICNNWVMLDPAVTVPDEAGNDLDRLADEGLLYHEFLHGQLLINAMLDDAAWQRTMCDCRFDLTPADEDHSEIDPLVDQYLDTRAAETANVTVVRPEAQTAEDDGTFDLDVGPATKEAPVVSVRFPSGGGNVDGLGVVTAEGRFRVRGRLVDPTLPGRFYLRIDPPTEWLIVGLEEAVVVLPSSAASLEIPALGHPGLVLLILLMALAAVIALWRRRFSGSD